MAKIKSISLNDVASTEYGKGWNEVATVPMQGMENVESIEVTERDFRQDDGSMRTRVSMCFTMKSGGQRYAALSRNSELEVGDLVDPSSVTVTVLERDGETIHRVDGEALEEE